MKPRRLLSTLGAVTLLWLGCSRAQAATFTVSNLSDGGPGSLRQAIADANAMADPDTIRFAPGLAGVIGLTGGELSITRPLTIEGPGAQALAVSGSQLSRVVRISGGGPVAISGLTITQGRASSSGGGIHNTGSTLALSRVVLTANLAVGAPGAVVQGGAIANLAGADLTVSDCLFTQNRAVGGSRGVAGGIFCNASRLTVLRSTFLANSAIGGDGGGPAVAGALMTGFASTGFIRDSLFQGNQALAGNGSGGAGIARAGAVYNFAATLTMEDCTLLDNLARGGSNNSGSGPFIATAFGGAIQSADQAVLFLSGSVVKGNRALGGSNNSNRGTTGFVGVGFGGGMANVSEATVTDCVFEDNEARGGNGNRGDGVNFQWVGVGFGGAINLNAGSPFGERQNLVLKNSTVRGNRAVGGEGNSEGTLLNSGGGGGVANNGCNINAASSAGGFLTIQASVIAHNVALGGIGGAGQGGGVLNILGGAVSASDSVFSHNRAQGAEGGEGLGGGLYNDRKSAHPSNLDAPTVLTLQNCTALFNVAQGGGSGTRGAGGGLWSGGSFTLSESSLESNMARGGDAGAGASGGEGSGGGLCVEAGEASCLNTGFRFNRAIGGNGTDGGDGLGGGAYNAPTSALRFTACTVTGNRANGGEGDGGPEGDGIGGGVSARGPFEYDAGTVIQGNHASTRDDDLSAGA